LTFLLGFSKRPPFIPSLAPFPKSGDDSAPAVKKGSRIYRLATGSLRAILWAFFRRVEVTGLSNLPETGGGIFIAWHPNALVDGALILSQFPGWIVVGARHGLFRWPILGPLMRALGAVPVYRRRDFPAGAGESRREANEKSIDAMAASVASGAFALLFPEGQSHDEPFPTELRTGAARVYYRARDLAAGGDRPVIVPVGLHYDRKHLFGSSALVSFHPPLDLPREVEEPPAKGANEEEKRSRNRALTDELEWALREVVHATESWNLHHAMHRARKILRAERAHRTGASLERPDMKERVLVFSRLWAGYNERTRTHPEEVSDIVERLQAYDADLGALGIEDHELYAGKPLLSPRLALSALLQGLLVYFVLPPLLLIGYVVNLPAAVFVWLLSRFWAAARKDVASLKIVAGAVTFPLLWLTVALLVAWGDTRLSGLYPRFRGAPLLTGALAFTLSAAGALVALHYQRIARQTLRAVRVRLTRWRRSAALERLRSERASLYEALRKLARLR
jgi:1-acyl-sn-glycerol-3-phosphate acyltransferase